MKVCIECGRKLQEKKFRAYETKDGIHYTSRCRLCESRRTNAIRKQKRLSGKLSIYSNDELVTELRRRGAYIMYGKDFEPLLSI